MRRRRIAVVVLALAASTSSACDPPKAETTGDAAPSPQASAIPAPLANAPTTTSSATPVATSPEAGPPPVPLRGDQPVTADSVPRETIGYTLSAVLRPGDLVGPPRAPEVNAAGLDAARKKTELRIGIDLAPARMRMTLLGPAWVLPAETEIRARADRFGHVVVWGGGASYRSVAPGTLRAFVGERRFDVAPITPAEVVAKEDVGKRIGVRTRRVEVSTRAAKATFEVGKLTDLGEGGILLCRALLDLMNAPPTSGVCGDSELPMRAELRWTGKGSMTFEVTGVLKKTDMTMSSLLVPPPNAGFVNAPLPAAGVTAVLAPAELAAFRTGPVDVPQGPPGVGDALVVFNATDQLRVLHLDGVPVAWAPPGAKETIHGLVRGRYIAQWRTFLGESFEPPATQSVPGLSQMGGADAGVR